MTVSLAGCVVMTGWAQAFPTDNAPRTKSRVGFSSVRMWFTALVTFTTRDGPQAAIRGGVIPHAFQGFEARTESRAGRAAIRGLLWESKSSRRQRVCASRDSRCGRHPSPWLARSRGTRSPRPRKSLMFVRRRIIGGSAALRPNMAHDPRPPTHPPRWQKSLAFVVRVSVGALLRFCYIGSDG